MSAGAGESLDVAIRLSPKTRSLVKLKVALSATGMLGL